MMMIIISSSNADCVQQLRNRGQRDRGTECVVYKPGQIFFLLLHLIGFQRFLLASSFASESLPRHISSRLSSLLLLYRELMTKMLVIIIYWTDSMITHREEGGRIQFPGTIQRRGCGQVLQWSMDYIVLINIFNRGLSCPLYHWGLN